MRKFIILLLIGTSLLAAPEIPLVNLSLGTEQSPRNLIDILDIIIVLTILTLAPSIVLVMTSFLRLIVVFSFLRTAMGTQSSPPTQVITTLALILTFFIMQPYGQKAYDTGIKPYMDKKISYDEAFTKSARPFKDFMIKNTREKDLALFFRIRKMENPKNIEEVPLSIIVPAFVISELKTAFQIGFLLYLPFLVIDLVVATILMSMGMMMLPPVMVSMPFKLLMFVLVDGFNLLTTNLVASFR